MTNGESDTRQEPDSLYDAMETMTYQYVDGMENAPAALYAAQRISNWFSFKAQEIQNEMVMRRPWSRTLAQ